MDIYSIYILMFFCIFLIMPTVYFLARFILWFLLDYCGWGSEQYRSNRRNRNNRQRRRVNDRQGNIYTISDDNALNAGPPRFADFFYLEPGSEEATRIRAQLEKDEKELPSYDEVMRMATLPQSPLAMESGTATMGVSTTSIATVATDLSIPAPPYTEVDLNATLTAATAAATSSAIAGTPSTSRAAASVVVPNTITTTTSTNA